MTPTWGYRPCPTVVTVLTVYKFTSYCLLLSISKLEHEWGQCCGAVPICPGSISVSYSVFSETFLKNQFNSKKLAGAACVFRLHVEKIGSSQRDRLRAASAPQHFMRLHVCLWMGTANHWSNLWASFYPLPPPNKKNVYFIYYRARCWQSLVWLECLWRKGCC